MSVVAQSPYTGKRLFEDDQDCQQERTGAKRSRFDSPGGRCRPAAHSSPHHHQQGIHPDTIRALKALFAEMDEQVGSNCIWSLMLHHQSPCLVQLRWATLTCALNCLQAVESVFSECGQDIDAAIRRLTELKLTSQACAHKSARDTAHSADDRQQQGADANGVSAASSGPQTAEQWVDALVQEMAAAKDFADARARAGKMLQAFEHFVAARSEQQVGLALQIGPCKFVVVANHILAHVWHVTVTCSGAYTQQFDVDGANCKHTACCVHFVGSRLKKLALGIRFPVWSTEVQVTPADTSLFHACSSHPKQRQMKR